MLDVIRVEREEDLAKAEAPAFCVIGTGQGRVDGRKIKTCSLLANERLAAIISQASSGFIVSREAFEVKDNIIYLLFGSSPLGTYAAIDCSPAFPYIMHAWRSSPDV
jgi:hypothetical protein